jgi:hypothetical protein
MHVLGNYGNYSTLIELAVLSRGKDRERARTRERKRE